MDIYWNIFTMHGLMNVKFPNNTSKWQIEFNLAFKGLISKTYCLSTVTNAARTLLNGMLYVYCNTYSHLYTAFLAACAVSLTLARCRFA
jgi:hypothetical protein